MIIALLMVVSVVRKSWIMNHCLQLGHERKTRRNGLLFFWQALPEHFPLDHLATLSRTFRYPIIPHDTARLFTNEESSAGGYTGAHDSSRVATESGLYTVDAHRVPDGDEEATVMVAEAEYIRMKWYQRPCFIVGLALFACVLFGAVVVFVVRQPSAASSSSLTFPTTALIAAPATREPTTPPPTSTPTTPLVASEPTSLTPVLIACNFLSIRDATTCRSISEFGGKTTGSTIPSEIGLLTQLTYLDFYENFLTSTIPSEIGLLTHLTYLNFYDNSLTSSIPSEVGLLTQLMRLDFYSNLLTSTIPSEIGLLERLTLLSFWRNSLTSTIPSEIGLLTQLKYLSFSDNTLKGTMPSSLCSFPSLEEFIFVDCGKITCDSGCCYDAYNFLCG